MFVNAIKDSSLACVGTGAVLSRVKMVVYARIPSIEEEDPTRIRFAPANVSGSVWPADGVPGGVERFVSLPAPIPVADGRVGPATSSIALLDVSAQPGTAMVPSYKRGTGAYPFVGGTEFYVVELTLPPPGGEGAVLASKAAPVDALVYIQQPGSVMTWFSPNGSLEHRYTDGDGNSYFAALKVVMSNVHPSVAVVATQIADNEVRMWYNGALYTASLEGFPIFGPTNFEVMLLGMCDSTGNPSDTEVGPYRTRGLACRLLDVSLHPGRVMSAGEVQQRTREYWSRYSGSAFDRSPQRLRYHLGPAVPGADFAHVVTHGDQRPTIVDAYDQEPTPVPPGDVRAVLGWFGAPYPAAGYRRWVGGYDGGVQYYGATAPAHPYPSLRWWDSPSSTGLAMLGPGAGPHSPFIPPGFGRSMGTDCPFAFRNATAILVLAPPLLTDGQPGFLLSKAAAAASATPLRLGPHSVALVQTPANELLFGVWGPSSTWADPAAAAVVSVAAHAGTDARLVVALRLTPSHVRLDVAGVGQQAVPVDAGDLPPPTPYELMLFSAPDATGNLTPSLYPWRNGRLFEVRLYEQELLSNAELAVEMAALCAQYQAVS